jgi:chromosome condensin MukBEF ATPase and DNA-binding subunit MukB
MKENLINSDWVQNHIYIIRGQKVMLSFDLANLYSIEPRMLIQSVKRNLERFPSDFMFQLENQEVINLKSQIVISSWGGSRALPYAFTEQGIAMLSSVLNSSRAIKVNIEIMRAFVGLRRLFESNKELSKKLDELEKKYDYQFKVVFDAIRGFMSAPEREYREIGIHTKK